MTYSSSNSLRRLLEDLVKQPFENHPQTPAWVDQVINTSYEYHRYIIIQRAYAESGRI